MPREGALTVSLADVEHARDVVATHITRTPLLTSRSLGERVGAHAFLKGYHTLRPLEDLERSLWPAMLRRAALRTWLGRLGYSHFPRDSHMTIPKDHDFSRRLLEHHIAHAQELEDTLD